MYCVVETVEGDEKFVTAVPKSWIIDGITLLWPKTKKDSVLGRKNSIKPSEDWQKMGCKILFDNIDSWEQAVKKEKDAEYLSSEDNSEEIVLNKNSDLLTDLNTFMSTLIPNSDNTPFTLSEDDVTITNVTTEVYSMNEGPTSSQFKELAAKLDVVIENQNSAAIKIENQQAMLENFMAKTEASINLLVEKFCQNSRQENVEDLLLDGIFPLTSTEQIEDIEEKIRKEIRFKKELVRKLSTFGGVDGMKTIRTICRCIFADSVLAEFSWQGTNVKKSFSKFTNLFGAIMDSVRTRYPSFSNVEGATFFKSFLKQAPFRLGKQSSNTKSNTSSSTDGPESTT